MDDGYIKLWRSVLDPQGRADMLKLGFWAWLCLRARWQKGWGVHRVGFQQIDIHQGQFFSTLEGVAHDTKLKTHKVRSLIDSLVAAGSLQKRSFPPDGTLFTIVNYAKWQGSARSVSAMDPQAGNNDSAEDPKLLPIGIKKEEVKKEEVKTPETSQAKSRDGVSKNVEKPPRKTKEAKDLPEWTLVVAKAIAKNATKYGSNPPSPTIERWRRELLKISESNLFSINNQSPLGEKGLKDLLRWGLQDVRPVSNGKGFPGWGPQIQSPPKYEKVHKILKSYHEEQRFSKPLHANLSDYQGSSAPEGDDSEQYGNQS